MDQEQSTGSSFIKRAEISTLAVCLILAGLLSIGKATVRADTFDTEPFTIPVLTAAPMGCSTGKIQITWGTPSASYIYQVYRDSTSIKIYEGPDGGTIDSGLLSGTQYRYFLTTTDPDHAGPWTIQVGSPVSCNTSATSSITTTTSSSSINTQNGAISIPQSPSGLSSVLDTSQGGIVLKWNLPSGSISGSQILKRSIGGSFVAYQSVAASEHSFIDTQFSQGVTYEYEVRACNTAGCSEVSNIASVVIPSVSVSTNVPVISTVQSDSNNKGVSTATGVSAVTGVTTPIGTTTISGTTIRTGTTTPNTSPGTNVSTVRLQNQDSNVTQPTTTNIRRSASSVVSTTSTVLVIRPSDSTRRDTNDTTRQSRTDTNRGSSREQRRATTTPSAMVVSMEHIADTVSSTQSVINGTRSGLISVIDAHLNDILEKDAANHTSEQALEAKEIRDRLVEKTRAALTNVTEVTPDSIVSLRAEIENRLKDVDTVLNITAAAHDASSSRAISTSIQTLTTTVQGATTELQASGGDAVYKDSNNDGISDYDSVHIYHLDPIAPSPVTVVGTSTLTAGEKVLLGYDPSSKILITVAPEEPLESLAPETTVYTVENIQLSPEKKVVIHGKALPNSYVTLYVYSTPIIVTVKTDSSGEWQYTVDKELETGVHTIYAATVDNTGMIVARSVAIPFTKTAEAATLDTALPIGATSADKPSLFNNPSVLPLLGLSLLFIIGVLYVIGRDHVIKPDTTVSP